ncbi:hypothetical protein BJF95_05215 [Rhizobium oryziradicis]|uniref:Knr4/Smi1-like domain-containing protein n=2 Tax=Rhizobium oryziradicis TaxID=1867956 RepID=A0A1Q8ZSC1_9HYPH|nr:hypothetical protein BJF95_05215 [Rhizobium oryziradicis]
MPRLDDDKLVGGIANCKLDENIARQVDDFAVNSSGKCTMTEQAYREALKLLKENGLDPLPVKCPSYEDIMRLEQRLNVQLPNSYRTMLLELGLLQVESIDIAGIGNSGLEGKNASNIVFATEKDRAEGLISGSMVRIGTSGYGPFYFIDCGELDGRGEAPVWEAPGNGVSHGKDRIADSFDDFLLREVRNLIEGLNDETEGE